MKGYLREKSIIKKFMRNNSNVLAIFQKIIHEIIYKKNCISIKLQKVK